MAISSGLRVIAISLDKDCDPFYRSCVDVVIYDKTENTPEILMSALEKSKIRWILDTSSTPQSMGITQDLLGRVATAPKVCCLRPLQKELPGFHYTVGMSPSFDALLLD